MTSIEQTDVGGSDALASGAEGRRIGPYRVLQELGRGGMGTVYLALRDDDEFKKRVALKVLRRGMDTDAIVQRFRHERQILAGLEHPFISALIDGGSTPEGLPYFAMEYVDGVPVDQYCERHQLDTPARLQLFTRICSAVQYAHQSLIIHCDIKPANVLVTTDATPKLLDFGIAKLLNPAAGQTLAMTIDGAPVLTPEYASPEQVKGDPVTTATDVYSLGVLLYQLLTGRRPYQLPSRSPAEIVRVICDSVPERPSTAVSTSREGGGRESGTPDPTRLRRQLAGDLDTIVLKAMSKDPSRRYASVDLFAEDIRRHLAGLPVLARPDTLSYRLQKFVGRNRTAVATGMIVAIALVAATVVAITQARAARRERERAEQRFEEVRQLANVALLDVHDAIRDLPGSTAARQLLVSKGLEYLDKLSGDAGDRTDLRRELAAAYVKIGDVQGRPSSANLGDTGGALDSYRKAVALYESLGADGSGDATLRRDFVKACQRLSEALSATGHTAEALVQARRALAVLEQPASPDSQTQGPVAAELGRDLAAGYTHVGDLLSATGDTSGALAQRRRAVAVMEAVAGLAPDHIDTIRQQAIAHVKLGNQLGNPNFPNVGDAPAALVELERAAAVLVKGVASHPSNAALRRNLAIVHSNVADVLLALDRRPEALARQRQALAAFEALSAADPLNAAARNDIAISVSKVAEMLAASGQNAAAVREFQRALAIHAEMASADRANDSLKLELASDHNRLATSLVTAGARADALAHHTRAVEMSRELQAANAANVELRVALGLALAGRADAYVAFARGGSRAADLRAAERDYAESVEIFTALEQEGAIQGTDLDTLRKNREALTRVRGAMGR